MGGVKGQNASKRAADCHKLLQAVVPGNGDNVLTVVRGIKKRRLRCCQYRNTGLNGRSAVRVCEESTETNNTRCCNRSPAKRRRLADPRKVQALLLT